MFKLLHDIAEGERQLFYGVYIQQLGGRWGLPESEISLMALPHGERG